MSHSLFKPYQRQQIKKPPLLRALFKQALYVFLFAFGMALVDYQLALPVLAAEFVFLLPQSYLIIKAFAHYGSGDFEKIKTGFYVGEFYKVVLSCALFVCLFILAPELNFALLFISYLLINFSFIWLIRFQINHPQ